MYVRFSSLLITVILRGLLKRILLRRIVQPFPLQIVSDAMSFTSFLDLPISFDGSFFLIWWKKKGLSNSKQVVPS
jgi:hypothetical protein